MPRIIAALAAGLLCLHAYAAPAPPAVRAEIDTLLGRLQASGCEFNRNGSWYDSTKAREHLQEKLDYIERRGNLQSTEQFVQLAASESSFSGKPYLVKCGREAAVPSRDWLTKELAAIRASRQSAGIIPAQRRP